MSLDEKLVKMVYVKYQDEPRKKEIPTQDLQYQAYTELKGTLPKEQFNELLHIFVDIVVDIFADRKELPERIKDEWVAAGMPDIKKFVWEKWSKEVFKLVNDKDEPRRIFVSLDSTGKTPPLLYKNGKVSR